MAKNKKTADDIKPKAQTNASPLGCFFFTHWARKPPDRIPRNPAPHVSIPKYSDTLNNKHIVLFLWTIVSHIPRWNKVNLLIIINLQSSQLIAVNPILSSSSIDSQRWVHGYQTNIAFFKFQTSHILVVVCDKLVIIWYTSNSIWYTSSCLWYTSNSLWYTSNSLIY